MRESDTLRAGPAGSGRSEDGMSAKRKKGAGKATPRAYRRLTRHERGTVQRMLERGASCRQVARELGRSSSTVSSEVASLGFLIAPRERRGERVDASADLPAACPRLAAWPRCCNGCGRYCAIGCKRRPHVFCEGFFRHLKNEFFHYRNWEGVMAEEFMGRLEAYLVYYREERIKKSLGWLSPMEYRWKLGYA